MGQDKINSEDTFQDVMTKLSEGNPSAMTALSDTLDTKGLTEFMKLSLRLDLLDIYGSDIWRLYSDHCEENADQFYDLLMKDQERVQDILDT